MQPVLKLTGAADEAETTVKRKTRRTIETVEERACIRAYDAAKASGGPPIPLKEVVEKIERRHELISRRAATKKTASRRDAGLGFSLAAYGSSNFSARQPHRNIFAERHLIG
jgi:hypothetical protein